MQDNATSSTTSRRHRSVADLSHADLGILAREYLLAGHLIDRAGMPLVTAMGLDVMTAVAIDEWMGASPIYTKSMQRLLGFGAAGFSHTSTEAAAASSIVNGWSS